MYVMHIFEYINRNGRLQPITSNETTYSSHLVKECILNFYALILKLYHSVITQSLMAILWTLFFALALSVKEIYLGNYFVMK